MMATKGFTNIVIIIAVITFSIIAQIIIILVKLIIILKPFFMIIQNFLLANLIMDLIIQLTKFFQQLSNLKLYFNLLLEEQY